MGVQSEHLIYALSAKGEMSMVDFNRLFSLLYSPDEPERDAGELDEKNYEWLRRDARRLLDMLGYCEFDYERGKVYACPPVLVELPVKWLPYALLTGTYTPEVLKRLEEYVQQNGTKDAVKIEKIPQSSRLMPEAIKLLAVTKGHLKNAAEYARIDFQDDAPAAWKLLNFSDDLNAIEHSVYFNKFADLQNWVCEEFSPEFLRFLPQDSENPHKSDERLATYYQRGKRYRRKCWIWNKDKQGAEIDRNWGRWLLMKWKRQNVLWYNVSDSELGVPAGMPLPRLLARSVALCSGLVPERKLERTQWTQTRHENYDLIKAPESNVQNVLNIQYDFYKTINKGFVEALAKKLGQTLININLT